MSKPPQLPPRLLTKDDHALLTHYSTLLHLLHHRNKNQHRRSPWYRHLSLFRTNLCALLADYTTLGTSPTTNLERARLKAQTPALQTRISKRLIFWQEVLVARWMRAFSQVVADGRFSVLGLVMLGILGGVSRVVGVVEGLDVEGQEQIERVLEEFGREAWGNDGWGEVYGGEDAERVDEGERVARVDEGEIVAREEVDDGVVAEEDGPNGPSGKQEKSETPRPLEDQSEYNEADDAKAVQSIPPSFPKVAKSEPTSRKKRSAETKPKATKKKRKKGGDAIDDLFSGW
jgi:ribonuclease MRP protein subunit RMP1